MVPNESRNKNPIVYIKHIVSLKMFTILDWRQKYSSQLYRKQVGAMIPISNKVDFKLKLMRRDKEGYFIPIKTTGGYLKMRDGDKKWRKEGKKNRCLNLIIIRYLSITYPTKIIYMYIYSYI